jgi:hypothetical protein
MEEVDVLLALDSVTITGKWRLMEVNLAFWNFWIT